MKKLPSIIFSLFIVTVMFLCYTPKSAYALTSNFWTNTGGNNLWSNASNWSLGHIPNSTTETATFDSAHSTANVTINASQDVFGVSIASSYTGTITQSSALTVEGGNYSKQAGRLQVGAATLR